MFSRILAISLSALSAVTAFPTYQGNLAACGTGVVHSHAHFAPTITPGYYWIAGSQSRRLTVNSPFGPVLGEGSGQPEVWRVDIVGADKYKIVSTKFDAPAVAAGNHVMVAKGQYLSDVWAIEAAGGNEWVVKTPDEDAVWKLNEEDPTVKLESADGSPDEHWSFIPLQRF